MNIGRKEYWEIGIDLEGNHRYGAWQIKEIIDLTLPPRSTKQENFMAELPEGTKNAEIAVKLTYQPSKNIVLELHRVTKNVQF